MQKLIIKDDSVVIEKGILFREQKDIKYKKINSVEIKHFL
jgi:conserved domain protein|nr:MAG TPA: Bacterial PH domain protein [Caudoviricetes sp.]